MGDYSIMQDHGEGTITTTLETPHEGFKREICPLYSMDEYSVNVHSHTSSHSLL